MTDRFSQQIVERIAALERHSRQQPNREGGGFWLPITRYQSAQPLSVNGDIGIMTIPRDLSLRTWVIALAVQTTNNASNYWTVTIERGHSGGGTTQIASINTSAIAADTWTSFTVTAVAGTELIRASHLFLYSGAQKTGSPGNLVHANSVIFFV